MVKLLDFLSFPNSTIRLSNSELFIDCIDSLYNDLTVTYGVPFINLVSLACLPNEPKSVKCEYAVSMIKADTGRAVHRR